jgi:hypothetical protein
MSFGEIQDHNSSTIQVHPEVHIYRKRIWQSLLIIAVILIVTVIGGYGLNWLWTGYPGNTLWDWMKLLLIPVGLVLATLYFSTERTWRKEWTYIIYGILLVLLVSIFGGYLLNWAWVGVQGNNLWNWFQLLFQPVGLAALSIFFGTKRAWSKKWTIVVGGIAFLLVVLIVGGYLLGWTWTGFKGNTLWNWIGMFVLPVALTVSAFSFKGYERVWAIILGCVGVALLTMMVGGYLVGWTWTGFQGNTLWDWLKILLLPIALTAVEPLFATYQEEGISAAMIVGFFMLVTVVGGYAFNWTWTGFQGTTLWSWFTLLLLPFGIAAARISFSTHSQPASSSIAVAQAEDKTILADRKFTSSEQSSEPSTLYMPANPYPVLNPYISEEPAEPVEPTVKAPAPVPEPISPLVRPARPALRERKGLLAFTLVAMLLILVGSGLGTAAFAHAQSLGLNSSNAATNGTLSFFSTHHHLDDGRLATNDGLKLTLHNLYDPAMGDAYYAWLQNAKDTSNVAALGMLSPKYGALSFSYIDARHRDLLTLSDTILITEEATNTVPTAPTTDKDLWSYVGSFPLNHSGQNTDGYHDQIIQLLSSDQQLESKGLHQGIDYWFLNNSQKLQQEAKDAKNQPSVHQTREDVARVLYYVDGKCTPYDLLYAPATSAGEDSDLIHDTSISLLNCDQDPDFEGYLTQMQMRLNQIAQNPAATPEQVSRATQARKDLTALITLLQKIRSDARQLVVMAHDQLADAKMLRADLALQASYLSNGYVDPTTHTTIPGAQKLVDNIGLLANMNITAYKM